MDPSSPQQPTCPPSSASTSQDDSSLLLFLASSPALAEVTPGSSASSPRSSFDQFRSLPPLSPTTTTSNTTSSSPSSPIATYPAAYPASSSSSASTPPPASWSPFSGSQRSAGDFVSRVAAIPVVNSITSFYEQSKSASPLVRLGADAVESSVKAAYRPLQTYVEPQLANFGNQQLDLLEQNYPILMERPGSMYETSKNYIASTISKQIGNALTVAESAVDHFLPGEQKPTPTDQQNGTSSHSTNGHSHDEASHNGHGNGHAHNGVISTESSLGRVQKIGSKVQSRIQRGAANRLNSVYVKSQETVQGLEKTVAVVSGAQDHIQGQSQQLKTTLQQMQLYMETKSIGLTSAIQVQANQALRNIATTIQHLQKDIMDTLKQAVDVISRSATVMPSYAQTKIKEFIMTLPARWAAINGNNGALPQDEEKFMNHGHQVVRFADESSAMLKSIADLIGQYIDRAKAFLESLKTATPTATPSSPSDTTMASPPPSSSEQGEDQMMTSPPQSPKTT